MNKKNIVTRKNIDKVAKFLKDSVEWLKENDQGCCHFNLSDDLALYVGWSDGWDMADEDIIKSPTGQRQNGSWTCGWAIDAAVKIRNDYDCADFEFLNFPWYPDDGECWNSSISMKPNMGKREYNQYAKWFLEAFVNMTNAHKKGEIVYA